MELIKNKRILAAVGIVGLLLGLMLPYYSLTVFGYSVSTSLWGYWEGKVIFVLTLASGLIIFKDLAQKYVPQLFNNPVGKTIEKINNPKFALVPSIMVAVYAIYLLTQLDVSSDYIKYGLGFYILWIGIIALIGHAIFYKNQQTVSPVVGQSGVGQSVQLQQPVNQQVQPQMNAQTTDYQVQQTQVASQTMNPQQVQMQPESNVAKKFCTNCGSQMDANADVCLMCNNRL